MVIPLPKKSHPFVRAWVRSLGSPNLFLLLYLSKKKKKKLFNNFPHCKRMKIDILYANISCLDFGYWFKYIRIMIIYTTEHEVPYEIKSYTTQWFNLDSAFIPSCITKAWWYRTTTIKSRTSKQMRNNRRHCLR
jgi:hypothetical protein